MAFVTGGEPSAWQPRFIPEASREPAGRDEKPKQRDEWTGGESISRRCPFISHVRHSGADGSE